MTDLYAVFGNPIAQSKSPDIHTAFAQSTGEKLVYEKRLAEVGEFVPAAKAFFADGGRGLNITAPFKLDAFSMAQELSERAENAGAVNTLLIKDGKFYGDNTDGFGLVYDITENLGWSLAGKKLLVLGAGGAVRGILQPILEANPSSVVVANRTASKAHELAKLFFRYGNIEGCGFTDLENSPFDMIINGTSASLTGELPPLPENIIDKNTFAYDLTYGAKPTVFMNWAAENKAVNIADGLGMLVCQAAESFYLWRGVRPETQSVINKIRQSLTA